MDPWTVRGFVVCCMPKTGPAPDPSALTALMLGWEPQKGDAVWVRRGADPEWSEGLIIARTESTSGPGYRVTAAVVKDNFLRYLWWPECNRYEQDRWAYVSEPDRRSITES